MLEFGRYAICEDGFDVSGGGEVNSAPFADRLLDSSYELLPTDSFSQASPPPKRRHKNRASYFCALASRQRARGPS